MNVREYLLSLIAAAGEVPGRTMAQKLVYLLARQRGEDAAFRPHFYGPYSDDVAAELAALVGSGLATEQIAVLDAWQPDQFDVYQYRYRLTAEGRQRAADVSGDLTASAKLLVERARDADAWSQEPLAAASKIAHLRDVEPDASLEDLGLLARDFGWRMTESTAARGMRLLDALDA
jgi:uncharacterized protein YwgA